MPVEINNSGIKPTGNTPDVENQKEDSASIAKEVEVPNHGIGELGAETPIIDENSNSSSNAGPTDPNSITVTISDKTTPIVILYGPPSCGKTMTLVRLTRYLKDQGYQVVPDKSFRDSQDPSYAKLCNDFNDIIYSNDAANSTAVINFMLVKILNSAGHPICQILEAPGEHYFMPGSQKTSYPPYISSIINSPNRKIWVVMLEPNWESAKIRSSYVNNIRGLNRRLMGRARVLFVYNKVDTTDSISYSDTMKEISDHFPGIFETFRNQNPITKFWKSYNCDLVRFCTGDYSKKLGGGQTYTPSDDSYPKALWGKLLKFING